LEHSALVRAERAGHVHAAMPVPAQDAEDLDLQVGRQLDPGAERSEPFSRGELSQAEPTVVVADEVVGEAALPRRPVAATERPRHRSERHRPGAAGRLAGGEAGVRLLTRSRAVVDVEPDHRARAPLGVDLRETEMLPLDRASVERAPPYAPAD